MLSWCPLDNDQDAFNRLLVTERLRLHASSSVTFEADDSPAGAYGNVKIVGAKELNRHMYPGDPFCIFNGTFCHMYGEVAGFRSLILRYVLDCNKQMFGLK